MNSAVLFRTPGHIPVEAFTTFGINVKPNSNSPIGFFGTGLKYVVAVLARHRIKLRVFIGTTEYEFYPKSKDFRGKDFDWLMMKKRKSLTGKWGAQELSYTTEHGKQWQLWQVVRELESNTRDENGSSVLLINEDYEENIANYNSDESLIIIEDPQFSEAYSKLDEIFLPKEKLTLRDSSPSLEIFNQPSKYLYYRGLRVYDLEQPSMFTYNYLQRMDLTEDRTLKYVFEARAAIARHIAKSKDSRLIHSIVGAEEKFFEHKVDFDFVYDAPSKEFMETIKVRRRKSLPLSGYAGAYYTKYAPEPRIPVRKMSLAERWQYEIDRGQVPANLHQLATETIEKLKELERLEPVDGPLDDEIPF